MQAICGLFSSGAVLVLVIFLPEIQSQELINIYDFFKPLEVFTVKKSESINGVQFSKRSFKSSQIEIIYPIADQKYLNWDMTVFNNNNRINVSFDKGDDKTHCRLEKSTNFYKDVNSKNIYGRLAVIVDLDNSNHDIAGSWKILFTQRERDTSIKRKVEVPVMIKRQEHRILQTKEGETITLSCSAQSFPVFSHFSWIKSTDEGQNWLAVESTKIQTHKQSNDTLVFSNMTRSDEAYYKCKAFQMWNIHTGERAYDEEMFYVKFPDDQNTTVKKIIILVILPLMILICVVMSSVLCYRKKKENMKLNGYLIDNNEKNQVKISLSASTDLELKNEKHCDPLIDNNEKNQDKISV